MHRYPSLTPDQDFDISRIKAKAYPCREVQGNIWVFFGKKSQTANDDAIPVVPDMGKAAPLVAITSDFPCSADHAAFGLMDPTHAAFVHTSWWWEKKRDNPAPERKKFRTGAAGLAYGTPPAAAGKPGL